MFPSNTPINYLSLYRCTPHGVPLYVGVVLPFVASSIASGVLLLGTSILLVCVSLKSILSRDFLANLILYLLFTIGWSAVLSKANASPSAAAALEVFFLLTGGLLGFYTFILYVVASNDVRNIWRQKIPFINKLIASREEKDKPSKKSTKQKYKSPMDIELTKTQGEDEIKLSQTDTIDSQLSPVSKVPIDQSIEQKPDDSDLKPIDSKSTSDDHNDQKIDV